MKRLVIVFLSAVCLLLALPANMSAVFAQEIETTPKEGPSLNAQVSYQVSTNYRIGVGDILSLAVYPQDEYSANDILVRSDGTATFPKIGEFQVYGKSILELTKELNTKLSRALRNHQVTISVINTRPVIFYLTGAVNRQGPFQMSTNAHEQAYAINNETSSRRLDLVLSNILSNAGGVTLKADLSQVQIKHRDGDAIKTVNLWKVLRQGSANDDPWLDPGDTVFVPELPAHGTMSDEDFKLLANSVLAPKGFPVRVIGEVKNPALIKLEGDSPYLSSALALTGGFAPQALKTAVAVRRFTDDTHFSTMFVNPQKMDVLLRPNDVVFIGESKLYKTGRFMREASEILTPFTNAASIAGNAAQTFGTGGWRRLSTGN